MIARARRVLASGDFDGLGRRPLFDVTGDPFPFFADHASGYTIRDTTGREYVDWVGRWGPVILGYQHPVVRQALLEQLDAGPILSMMHPIQIEVAEMLASMIPCAEMVAFGKNGSDACCAAVRLARAVTGREMILQYGFHGFHDWCMVHDSGALGIPNRLSQSIESVRYNRIDLLTKQFQRLDGQVAAVIMEPVHMWMPDPGYLEAVRELTRRNGALLIFDEMVTSFRLARGGAQELFGVTPDLTCLGKAMGNGMPLSALVGKRAYMQRLQECGFGMCFQIETLSLAVAKAVLRFLQAEPVVEHLAEVGRTIRSGVDDIAAKVGVDCKLVGPDARMTFVFDSLGKNRKDAVRTLFQQECMRNGVLTNGSVLPCYAHDDSAIDRSLGTFELALEAVGRTLDRVEPSSNSADQTTHVSNQVMPQYATGFIDELSIQPNGLTIRGWLFLQDGPPDHLELHFESGDVLDVDRVERPDLEQPFAHIDRVTLSGFEATIEEKLIANESQYEFTLVAFRRGRVAFRCLVRPSLAAEGFFPHPLHDGVVVV